MKKLTIILCVFLLAGCSKDIKDSSMNILPIYDESVNQALDILGGTESGRDLANFFLDNPTEIRFYETGIYPKLELENQRIYLPEKAKENLDILTLVLGRAINSYMIYKQEKVRDVFYAVEKESRLAELDILLDLYLKIKSLDINPVGAEIADFVCTNYYEDTQTALQNYEMALEKFSEDNEYEIRDIGYVKYWNSKLHKSLNTLTPGEVVSSMEGLFQGDKNETHNYEISFLEKNSYDNVVIERLKQQLYYKEEKKLDIMKYILDKKRETLDKDTRVPVDLEYCKQILYRK